MSQHDTIRIEIRLQLLRASDRLRAAAQELDRAIEALDHGNFWDAHASDARIEADIASTQMQTARGMAQVASLMRGGAVR
jgi:hypothetical protein